MLDLALSQGIGAVEDPPVELVNLFKQLDDKPERFDNEEIERGRVIQANGSSVGKLAAHSQLRAYHPGRSCVQCHGSDRPTGP